MHHQRLNVNNYKKLMCGLKQLQVKKLIIRKVFFFKMFIFNTIKNGFTIKKHQIIKDKPNLNNHFVILEQILSLYLIVSFNTINLF